MKKLVTGKMINNRGFTAIFVGYPEDYSSGIYTVLNLDTKKFVITRTVDWNDESYGETKKLKHEKKSKLKKQLEDIKDNKSYEMLDIGTDMTEDTDINGEPETEKVNQPAHIKKLVTFYNPNPNKQEIENRVLRSRTTQERASTILDTTAYEWCFLNREEEEG